MIIWMDILKILIYKENSTHDGRDFPNISQALFAITSFTFILVYVPDPVYHIFNGKWSLINPYLISSQALTIAIPLSLSNLYCIFTIAEDFLRIA